MPVPSVPTESAGLAPFIDHTILRPDAQPADVERLCDEARAHGFKAVCVNPVFIPLVTERLAGTPVAPCAVICFPFGGRPHGDQGRRGGMGGPPRRPRGRHGDPHRPAEGRPDIGSPRRHRRCQARLRRRPA
nr:hypothetical protein [Azospirillum sp. INR13]